MSLPVPPPLPPIPPANPAQEESPPAPPLKSRLPSPVTYLMAAVVAPLFITLILILYIKPFPTTVTVDSEPEAEIDLFEKLEPIDVELELPEPFDPNPPKEINLDPNAEVFSF